MTTLISPQENVYIFPKVNLYTDGSYRPTTGIGSHAGILQSDDHVLLVSDSSADTTINRQELLAVIASLNTLVRPCDVTIYSDSNYVVKGINSWMHQWKQQNWITTKGTPVANRDLWEALFHHGSTHKLMAIWVKAHTGQAHHPYFENNIVDNIAQSMSIKPK